MGDRHPAHESSRCRARVVAEKSPSGPAVPFKPVVSEWILADGVAVLTQSFGAIGQGL